MIFYYPNESSGEVATEEDICIIVVTSGKATRSGNWQRTYNELLLWESYCQSYMPNSKALVGVLFTAWACTVWASFEVLVGWTFWVGFYVLIQTWSSFFGLAWDSIVNVIECRVSKFFYVSLVAFLWDVAFSLVMSQMFVSLVLLCLFFYLL